MTGFDVTTQTDPRFFSCHFRYEWKRINCGLTGGVETGNGGSHWGNVSVSPQKDRYNLKQPNLFEVKNIIYVV